MPSILPKTTVLGYNNAYHLLRRTTYHVTKTLINQYASKTPQEALISLFQNDTLDTRPLTDSGQTVIPTISNPNVEDSSNAQNSYHRHWFINNLLVSNSIVGKLSIFLHTCFITDELIQFFNCFDYLELLRYHSNNSLKDLAIRMTKNIRMLSYLDNRLNHKDAPNENYAREFLELFTILKGEQIALGNYTTYTEHDVQQAARVFTGFTSINSDNKYSRLNTYDTVTLIPEGFINVAAHDTDNKTFSAAFGNQTIVGGTDEANIQQELEDFVDMVFNQMATAKSYARRLYRFFVGREITYAIEQDIITPLAQTLYNNNYNIQSAITQLLCSQHFYDEDDSMVGDNVIGNLVKSPLDLIIQLYTIFEVNLPDYVTQTGAANTFLRTSIYNDATTCGFQLLRPVDVNGYPAYSEAPLYDKNWVTTNNLKPRYDKIIDKLLAGYTVNGFLIKLDSTDFVHNSGYFTDPANATTLLQEFFDLLFVSTPTGARYIYFEQALLGGLSVINWQVEWQNYIASNDATEVTIGLDNLIKTMVKSPEFQVM